MVQYLYVNTLWTFKREITNVVIVFKAIWHHSLARVRMRLLPYTHSIHELLHIGRKREG